MFCMIARVSFWSCFWVHCMTLNTAQILKVWILEKKGAKTLLAGWALSPHTNELTLWQNPNFCPKMQFLKNLLQRWIWIFALKMKWFTSWIYEQKLCILPQCVKLAKRCELMRVAGLDRCSRYLAHWPKWPKNVSNISVCVHGHTQIIS